MKPTATGLLLVLLLGTGATRVAADEIGARLDAAKQAYEAGELRRAVEAAELAVADIRERITAGLLTLFPPPTDDWTAEEAESRAGGVAAMLTGTSLKRRYVRGDGAEVVLTILADSPMMPMLTMAISMPFMLQANQNLKAYTLKGERGMMEHTPGSRAYKITLMVGDKLLIQGEGTGLDDQAPLEQYLQALDLDALQKAMTD